jgi:hypothetical protein
MELIPHRDNAVPQKPRSVLHCLLLENFASISYYLSVSVREIKAENQVQWENAWNGE